MPAGFKRSSRSRQIASKTGPGVHYTSPLKPRDKRKKRVIEPIGRPEKIENLRARLDALRNRPADNSKDDNTDDIEMSEPGPAPDSEWVDEPAPAPPPIFIPGPSTPAAEANNRRRVSWDVLLPHLEDPLAEFRMASHGQRPTVIPSLSCGQPLNIKVQCLYLTHLEEVQVATCACMPFPALLVKHGVFPASPTKPRTFVSIDLLEVYRALFERSCDAITALAAALHKIYERRGFRVLSLRVRA
ncbi:hypothetical protein B0H11DRAFT_1938988 [Mycena galericulata]|nr:hypothetical protein B0H11DRAFT_1938988 [Mycena galericulata]